jgi:hypothetical protein
MKHHAERIERIRRLLLEMEQQQEQLETMTRETMRMRAELRRQLRQAITDPTTASDRPVRAGRRQKKPVGSKKR